MNQHFSAAHGHAPRGLGSFSREQLQAALDRFGLGELIGISPVPAGLGAQNLFFRSTRGEYVFRGNPAYPWQFPKECFAAALLHERSRLPVPHPYLFDQTTEIFGWQYVIMPRMPGVPASDRRLSEGEHLWVARAIGASLTELHEVTWPIAGEYDPDSNEVRAFGHGYSAWLKNDTRRWMALCRDGGWLTSEDEAWIEQVIDTAATALTDDFRPAFVMHDYNLGNVLVECADGEWRLSGLFDFVEYYLGDPEADLVRPIAAYLDMEQHQDTRLASAFAAEYFQRRPARPGFVKRYALWMVRDRLQIWEYAHRMKVPILIPAGWSFRAYAARYCHRPELFASLQPVA